MKEILLISYNYSPELTGVGKYNGEMIDWLSKSGYRCSVLTSYPYYPFWKVQEPYFRRRFLFSVEEKRVENAEHPVRVYRCPMYVPSKPTGLKRIMLDLSFFLSALLRLITLLPGRKFDFVIAVAPSFQVGLLGLLYKKIRGAKLIYHIQDLQIEAARDLNMIKSQTIVNALLKTEKQIFNHADMISSISDEMVDKVEHKSGKRTILFPNWTDTRQFYPIKDRDGLKAHYGFSGQDKVFLYSGAVGEKQGLECIIEAAHACLKMPHFKFVICGTGPYKEKLVAKALERNLDNVYFLPLQPVETFNTFLNMADVHLVIQKACASDLVMPSKLGAILSVGGLALVTANPGSSLHTLVKRHEMGLVVDAEDQLALERGIHMLASGDFSKMRSNARRYAVDSLSIECVMANIDRTFNKLWLDGVAYAGNVRRRVTRAKSLAGFDVSDHH